MKTCNQENFFSQLINEYKEPFSLRELKHAVCSMGFSLSTSDLKDALEANPNILHMENDLYITKAGAFSGEIFSILPTSEEFENGVLVCGDRCVPFLDSERSGGFYSFYINGKKIPSKVGEFDSDHAIDMFILFGEEYAPQYIASDPANDINMVERDFELPNKVKLTGIDLDFLKRNYHFNKGDRLLCCVSDWNKCKINIMIIHSNANKFDKGDVGEKRLEWYSQLENYLLESFDKYGPLSTIEEQLVNVYFAHRKELCVPYCGSFEEYLERYAKKVALQNFGVETRLWKKGEDVPAFGNWNKVELNQMERISDKIPFSEFILDSVPDFVIDQYVLDSFYLRKPENLVENFISSLSQNEFSFDEKVLEFISLNLKERSDILKEDYNWFRDQILGPIRKKALDLYGKVLLLIRKLDYEGSLIEDFPQQEIVILSQLYGHLMQMLEAISFDPNIEDSADEFSLSLDGMQWNFEEIKGTVELSLQEQELNRFAVSNLDSHGKK